MRKTPELQRFLFSSPFPSRKTNMETFPGYLSISSTENKWRFYLSWFTEDIRNHVSLPAPKILFFSLLSLYLVFLFTSKEVHHICSSPDYFLVLFGFPFLGFPKYFSFLYKSLKHSVFDLLFYLFIFFVLIKKYIYVLELILNPTTKWCFMICLKL